MGDQLRADEICSQANTGTIVVHPRRHVGRAQVTQRSAPQLQRVNRDLIDRYGPWVRARIVDGITYLLKPYTQKSDMGGYTMKVPLDVGGPFFKSMTSLDGYIRACVDFIADKYEWWRGIG